MKKYVEVEVVPVAAVRPKVTRWNTYYPGEYGSYLPKLKQTLKDVYDSTPVGSLCRLRVVCVLPRPKSHYGTGRNARVVKKSAPVVPHQDVDNLLKGAMDAATGILYDDDKLVVEVSCVKRYGKPRLSYELEVLELGVSSETSE